MEKTVQLCVVGAAGSGMSAAVSAAQHGVREILVLEKSAVVGGCTSMSAGMMGINTPVQRRFGYKLDPDEYFRKLMKVLNWRCDAKLVRKWLNGSGENFEWLEDLGLSYSFPCTESADMSKVLPTHNRTGFWNGSKWVMEMHGPKVVRTLKNACDRYGVEVLTKTRARHLIRGEDGRVIGVEAEGPDGEAITIHAGAVILATGSISSNEQLIRRFYQSDEYKDIRIMAQVPHNTGDGLIMAEEIGAAAGRIGTLFIGPHNHYAQASEVMSVLLRRPQPIKVNQNGERFTDESLPFEEEFGWMMAVSVDQQPGKKSFSLTDQAYIDACMADTDYRPARFDTGCQLDEPANFGTPCPVEKDQDPATWRERIPQHLEYEQALGRAKICQTLAEAAEFIGCDEQTLQATVDHYNLCCARGYDDEFLKAKEYLVPVRQQPYYVMMGMSGIDTCLGGLKIDNRQRVLDTQGRHIPGLYAAGVMCSGWFNDNYCFFGSEMSFTIYSGRTSGQEAAGYLGL